MQLPTARFKEHAELTGAMRCCVMGFGQLVAFLGGGKS